MPDLNPGFSGLLYLRNGFIADRLVKLLERMFKDRAKYLIFLLLLMIISLTAVQGQEHKVNQKKINKEREKKQKKADQEYRNAVKHHKKIQSKNTKAMMHNSRKESGSLTPVKR